MSQQKKLTKEEARKRIAASKKRTLAIRNHEYIPAAVRLADQGGGAFSVKVIDLATRTGRFLAWS